MPMVPRMENQMGETLATSFIIVVTTGQGRVKYIGLERYSRGSSSKGCETDPYGSLSSWPTITAVEIWCGILAVLTSLLHKFWPILTGCTYRIIKEEYKKVKVG